MPSRKRAASVTCCTDGKRQRVDLRPSIVCDEGIPAPADLTALDSVVPPVFRLPAELRDKIWAFAYGDLKIHVCNDHVPFFFSCRQRSDAISKGLYATRPSRLSYKICMQHSTPAQYQDHYEQTLADDRLPYSYTNMTETQQRVRCCSKGFRELKAFSLPLVSRQFWYEASKVFLASCTFSFENALHLRTLLLDRKHLAARIRRLELNIDRLGEWAPTLTCSAIRKLETLQGLTLILHNIGVVNRADSSDTWNSNDVMKLKTSDLPSAIRAFQQHELQERLITVAMLPPPYAVAELRGLSGTIRGLLLEPHPRRHAKCGLAKRHLADITRRQRNR